MEIFFAIIILAIGAYLGIAVLIAFFKGTVLAGKKIVESGPTFFSSVVTSIVAGVIAGFLVSAMAGTDFQLTGATSAGVALGTFVKSYVL